MDTFGTIAAVFFAVIGVIVVAAGIGLLLAFPIMWCWNYSVVYVWHLPKITWGMAWCLSFLSITFIKSTLNCKK
jgi:hypothetical protein